MPNTREEWEKKMERAMEVVAEGVAMGFMPLERLTERITALASNLRPNTPTFDQGMESAQDYGLGAMGGLGQIIKQFAGDVEPHREGMNPGTRAGMEVYEQEFGERREPAPMPEPEPAPRDRGSVGDTLRFGYDTIKEGLGGQGKPAPATPARPATPASGEIGRYSPDQIMSMSKTDFEKEKERAMRGRYRGRR